MTTGLLFMAYGTATGPDDIELAVAWLDALSPADALRLAALRSSKFQWLAT